MQILLHAGVPAGFVQCGSLEALAVSGCWCWYITVLKFNSTHLKMMVLPWFFSKENGSIYKHKQRTLCMIKGLFAS